MSCTPAFMHDMFQPKLVPYDLRTKNLLLLPTARTGKFGSNSFIFRETLLWNSLPGALKSAESFQILKDALSTHILVTFCTYKLCIDAG